MAIPPQILERLEKIDQDLITLLIQRMRVYQEIDEGEEPESEDEVNMADNWVQTAEDQGADEPDVFDPLSRAVLKACKKGQE